MPVGDVHNHKFLGRLLYITFGTSANDGKNGKPIAAPLATRNLRREMFMAADGLMLGGYSKTQASFGSFILTAKKSSDSR